MRNYAEPNLYNAVALENDWQEIEVPNYSSHRWISAVQTDYAARISWTLTPHYSEANHPPQVRIVNGNHVCATADSTVPLTAAASDPDGDKVALSWWN